MKYIRNLLSKFIITIIFLIFSSSCTKNEISRTFGGTITINVEKGKKVTMATWKDTDLFYMIEDMDSDYVPHDKMLVESSSHGIIESKVIFKESR